MSEESHEKLNDLIEHLRRSGYFCVPCLSCGMWVAEESVKAASQWACPLYRCKKWRNYRDRNGRAPPQTLVDHWNELWGEVHADKVTEDIEPEVVLEEPPIREHETEEEIKAQEEMDRRFK